jgi:hypothetical protein
MNPSKGYMVYDEKDAWANLIYTCKDKGYPSKNV